MTPDTWCPGEISVSGPLDRETVPEYNLIVQAYDNYQYGFTTGDSRHSFMQLKVIPQSQSFPQCSFCKHDFESQP